MKRNPDSLLARIFKNFYCIENYALPKDTCDYIPKLIFMFIFATPYIAWNHFAVLDFYIQKKRGKSIDNYAYHWDYDFWKPFKASFVYNMLFYGVVSLIYMYFWHDFDINSVPIIIALPGMLVAALGMLAGIALVSAFIVLVIDKIKNIIAEYRENKPEKEVKKDKGPSALSVWIKNIKEKTCTPIEWTNENT